ncbi:hypothetical protein EJ03DRAFT_339383 [Teratosphaeria nubilosa]|uniref:Uncharacterized protein n=1 Tax=Teratosphaeria nubilosa TaxID=161662 RepID=A0A6G1KWF2_9PEZI|nr:hypothetical protein EJ03DRAFT_339383 [Teratosphaeria nubilosa]
MLRRLVHLDLLLAGNRRRERKAAKSGLSREEQDKLGRDLGERNITDLQNPHSKYAIICVIMLTAQLERKPGMRKTRGLRWAILHAIRAHAPQPSIRNHVMNQEQIWRET